jgi:hypothetical protein
MSKVGLCKPVSERRVRKSKHSLLCDLGGEYRSLFVFFNGLTFLLARFTFTTWEHFASFYTNVRSVSSEETQNLLGDIDRVIGIRTTARKVRRKYRAMLPPSS